MGDTFTDPLRAGHGFLITGPRGQLGTALTEVFPAADRTWYDVTRALPVRPELVLHAAAWTDVDAAEAEREAVERVNVLGTRNVVATGAPVVYFSTDYVFDGAKGEPYVESDQPNPLSVYGRTKLQGEREIEKGWIVRSSWLFGPTERTSFGRCSPSGSSGTRCAWSPTSAGAPRTSSTSRQPSATLSSSHMAPTTSPGAASAAGRSSPRRSSTRRIFVAESCRSRAPS